MSEQSTITLSNLPANGDDITASDGQAAAILQIANEFNKQVPTSKISAEQSWTSFTPTWTASGSNPVLGNGSITGSYLRMGRMIIYKGGIGMGSTTTYGSGRWFVDLPIPDKSANQDIGVVRVLDLATNNYVGACMIGANTAHLLQFIGYGTATEFTATIPITWGSGDSLSWTIIYESAS